MTKRSALLLAAIVATIVLAGFYVHGSLDRPLSSIGLNFHECARNGLGATFCGSELDEYRARLEHVRQAGEETTAKIRRESEATRARLKEERATAEARTKREEAAELEAKLAKEKRIYETEPAGSFGRALAKGEYEAARAQLRQLAAG
jgi:Skp family chaperone for outer membrane proteins